MDKLALTLPGSNSSILNPTRFNDLGSLLSGLFNVTLYIAMALLIAWLSWGIFEYIFAGGEKEKLGKARQRITWAIVGFVIIILALTISRYVEEFFPAQMINIKGVTPP